MQPRELERLYLNNYYMSEDQKKALFAKAIEKWGRRAQLEMAQEEATEMALAVRKFIRYDDPTTRSNLAEEIADVEIMIEQLKNMFPNIKSEIDSQTEFKLGRLEERVRRNQFNEDQ